MNINIETQVEVSFYMNDDGKLVVDVVGDNVPPIVCKVNHEDVVQDDKKDILEQVDSVDVECSLFEKIKNISVKHVYSFEGRRCVEELKDLIDVSCEFMTKYDLNIYEFAELCGLSKTSIRALVLEERDRINLKTFEKIMNVLKLEPRPDKQPETYQSYLKDKLNEMFK